MIRSKVGRFFRRYSISQYVPESERYVFENEKLSQEEILAKIPKRPLVDETKIRQHYYTIIPPKSVCDAVINPEFDEIFLTSLSKGKKFGGSEYKAVVRPSKIASDVEAQNINLHFESKVHSWINEFKNSSFELQSIPEEMQGDTYVLNKRIERKIVAHLSQTSAAPDSFFEVYTKMNIFSNHEKKLNGELHQSEIQNMVSFDNLLIYFLKNIIDNGSQDFVELLTFIERYLTYATYNNGILPMMELLIPYLRHSYNIKDSLKRDTFDRFFSRIEAVFPEVYEDLALPLLDQLAFVSYESTNTVRGARIIENSFLQYNISPSRETYQALLNSLIVESEAAGAGTASTRNAVLAHLSLYKPIIHHLGIDELSFVLIRQTVSTTFELDHLVKFIQQQDNSKDLLEKIQLKCFEILSTIHHQSRSLNLIKTLEYKQLQRRLEAHIQLDQKTTDFIAASISQLSL